MFVRSPNGNFNLANFMRVQLFTALGALRTGLNILLEKESVHVDQILGHALGEGMRTLRQDGMEKVLAGITDMKQVRKVCVR